MMMDQENSVFKNFIQTFEDMESKSNEEIYQDCFENMQKGIKLNLQLRSLSNFQHHRKPMICFEKALIN